MGHPSLSQDMLSYLSSHIHDADDYKIMSNTLELKPLEFYPLHSFCNRVKEFKMIKRKSSLRNLIFQLSWRICWNSRVTYSERKFVLKSVFVSCFFSEIFSESIWVITYSRRVCCVGRAEWVSSQMNTK